MKSTHLVFKTKQSIDVIEIAEFEIDNTKQNE